MMKTRLVFLSASVLVVTLFTGVIVASREAEEDLFKALGNLAEVIHLVRNEYVDELHTEALQLSLDAGIAESVDQAAAVLQITGYVNDVEADAWDGFPGWLNLPATDLLTAGVSGGPLTNGAGREWKVANLPIGTDNTHPAGGQPNTGTFLYSDVTSIE